MNPPPAPHPPAAPPPGAAPRGGDPPPGNAADQAAGRSPPGGLKGLLAILAAIVLGGLVGVFYGRPMWMASGGAEAALERLEKTLAQKFRFAERDDRQVAELTDQAAQIDRLAAEREAAGQHREAERLRGEAAALRRRATVAREEAARLRGHVPVIEAEIARMRQVVAEHQARMGEMPGRTARDPAYIRQMTLARYVATLTEFAGDMFLQTLKLIVIPLVVTSMIAGITSLGDIRRLGRVGGWTIAFYLSTAGAAVLLGIVLVLAIQPGVRADDTFAYVSETVEAKEGATVLETMLNVFRGQKGDPGSGMFPENIVRAAAELNVLALIAFALLFGAALTTLGDRGRPAIDFFQAANEAVMKLVHLVMWFAPVGIYGLVAANIARQGGGEAFGEQLQRLAWYVLTVCLGLAIHMVLLGALLGVAARRNPFRYTYHLLRALLTAMSTASSSATLPVTMECCEKKAGVSKRATSFVLPLGATVNMDGTALYEAVAVIFIAQSIGMELTLAQLVVIFITATLAAIGAAGIPEAGLVTMVIVLTAVGLPLTGIGTILAIDWFLDRMRTTVNVYGDAIGAAVIDYRVISPR